MKANKELLHSEFNKVWGTDTRMSDYCTNKVATMAILPDGGIIAIDRQKVVKDFYFGESGYDSDDACDAAHNARTNQDYFLSENMRAFRSYINSLEECKDANGNCWLHIEDIHYTGQPEDCKIRSFQFARTTEVIEAVGPSFLHELFGKQAKIRGCAGHMATVEEIEAILEAYKEAAADHEKKVRSYLKRYGTSKVHAWTYWRDA